MAFRCLPPGSRVVARWAGVLCCVLCFVNEGQVRARQGTKARVLEICGTMSDDLGVFDRLYQEVVGFGEEGREALAAVASSDDAANRCALQYLERLRDPRAIPIARGVLRDPAAPSRMQEEALRAVATFRDAAMFDTVMAIFRAGDRNLLNDAAIALGKLGDPRGMQALLETLNDPKRASVAIGPVGVPGYEAAIDPLLHLIDRDPSALKDQPLLVDKVILSLGRIATPRSRQAAVDSLPKQADMWFRTRDVSDLWVMFQRQKASARDPKDVADIDGLFVRLREDPAASPWMKKSPAK
jgi:hypothetical protein